jgi:hypothetical protein
MATRRNIFWPLCAAVLLTAGAVHAGDDGAGAYCMDFELQPFHMAMDGSCAVRDHWGGWLQEQFYPFTIDEHLFNCEYFGPTAPLPTGQMVPSSVVSDGSLVGSIGGHPFTATLYCASLTNWYQDSCLDPEDPTTCTVQLAQPFLMRDLPFPRVTEVSIFDGEVTVQSRYGEVVVPLVIATRAAGITHLESMEEVGASITHSLLGMVTYDGGIKVLRGSMDALLQGHIFSPDPVGEDESPATVKGTICSRDLYLLLNRSGGGKGCKH